MAPSALERCGFYLPHRRALVDGADLPATREVGAMAASEDAWITQTYLHLRHAGHPVRAVDERSVDGLAVLVVHPRHLAEALRARGHRRTAVVVTEADKTFGRPGADFVVAQNGLEPGANRVVVPHWPQPGLVGRDAGRSGIRCAAYKGRREVLHPELAGDGWRRALADLGIEWRLDDDEMGATGVHAWADYASVDVVVALRAPDRDHRKAKPASKLVNAWLAGVPAVLGTEPQYRELRRDELDYVEVADPAGAIAALAALRDDPGRYQRMVDNGRRRAEAYTVAALTRRWVDVLDDLVARAEARPWPQVAYRRSVQWAYRRRATDGRAADSRAAAS